MSDQPTQKQDRDALHRAADGLGDPLDGYFAAARMATPQPDPDFMRRVLQEALDVQASRMEQSQTVQRPRKAVQSRPGIWAQLRDAMGGWPALGGLAMAGVTGLAVGIASPAGLGDLTRAITQPAALQDGYLVDLAPEMEFDIAMDLNED